MEKIFKKKKKIVKPQTIIEEKKLVIITETKPKFFPLNKTLFYILLALLAFSVTFISVWFVLRFSVKLFQQVVPTSKQTIFTGYSNHYYEPYVLLSDLQKHNSELVLIDLRSKAEYQKGHIKEAQNIPVYKELNWPNKLELNLSQFNKEFRILVKNKSLVVLYGNSGHSQLPEYVYSQLTNKNNVYLLSVGWNEWRHFHNLWIPEGEWNKININDFIQVP